MGALSPLVNPLVKAVLRSRFHGLLSRSLVLLAYTGRRSGRPRSLPVMYAESEGHLVVVAARAGSKRWWRNFRGGAPAELVLRGERLPARAEVVAGDRAAAADDLARYAARFPRAGEHLRADDDLVVVRIVPARRRERAARG